MKRQLKLKVISEAPLEPPSTYRDKFPLENIPFVYTSLNKEIIKADAVILPQPIGDERAKYKSNNKTLQAWALRMPVINVPEDLDKFITGESREAEATLRRKEIEDKWETKYSVQDYKDLIEEIKKRKNESKSN
jgi:hypothetical protein